MEQEKNLNEEITEATEEVVETAEEVVETVEEVTEVVKEKVRPKVNDDFSEEEPKPEKKEKKSFGCGFMALSTLVSSIISVVLTLTILFFMSAVPKWTTAAQIEGVWALDMTEYGMGNIYLVLNDDKLAIKSEQGGVLLTCDYAVTEKGKIEISADDNEMMMVNQLIGTTELKVKYDEENNAVTFSPAIGGIATWNGVDETVEKSVIESLDVPVDVPTYDDITSDVPTGSYEEVDIPEEGVESPVVEYDEEASVIE